MCKPYIQISSDSLVELCILTPAFPHHEVWENLCYLRQQPAARSECSDEAKRNLFPLLVSPELTELPPGIFLRQQERWLQILEEICWEQPSERRFTYRTAHRVASASENFSIMRPLQKGVFMKAPSWEALVCLIHTVLHTRRHSIMSYEWMNKQMWGRAKAPLCQCANLPSLIAWIA